MQSHPFEPLPDFLPSSSPLALSEPLLTTTDVSLLLGVPRSSVHDYAKRPDDRLPSVRIGRHRRFYRSELERLARAAARMTASQRCDCQHLASADRNESGQHRMRRTPASVDAGHVKPSTFHHSSTDERLAVADVHSVEPVAPIAWPEPELCPPRRKTVMSMRTRIITEGYRIDADAVAEAIVERLFGAEHQRPLRAQAA